MNQDSLIITLFLLVKLPTLMVVIYSLVIFFKQERDSIKKRNLKNHDNWITPAWFYNELDLEFSFDFDPCPISFGEIPQEQDGLIISWGQRNFVNPPYSRALKDKFVKKAIYESQLGKLCVCLLPVSTSTALFHDHILPNQKEIRFVRRRLLFTGINSFGEKVDSSVKGARPMHDSMIVIFDGREEGQSERLAIVLFFSF